MAWMYAGSVALFTSTARHTVSSGIGQCGQDLSAWFAMIVERGRIRRPARPEEQT